MMKSDKHFFSQHRIALLFFPVILGGIVACSTPASPPSVQTQDDTRELVLKATTISVNRLAESEVIIRFDPPEGMHVTNLRYSLDQGTWNSPKDLSAGWHISTDRLTLGEHTVEMRALVNGKRPLFGVMYLNVVEENIQETSWGGGPASNVVIVL